MAFKIVIDAGHGGYDSGAVANGLKEKDLTLQTAQFLEKLLAQDERFEILMTRDGDFAPSHLENQLARELAERAKMANNFNADLFVSIHFNSTGSKTVRGSEVEVDKDEGLAGKFAHALLDLLTTKEGMINRGVKETGTEFAVIRETKMPAVITESAFISNTEDVKHVASVSQLMALAKYHYEALCIAFGIQPKYKNTTVVTQNTPTQTVSEVKVATVTQTDVQDAKMNIPTSEPIEPPTVASTSSKTPVEVEKPTPVEPPKIFVIKDREEAINYLDALLEFLKGEDKNV